MTKIKKEDIKENDIHSALWADLGNIQIRANGFWSIDKDGNKMQSHKFGICPVAVTKAVGENGKTAFTSIRVKYRGVSTDLEGNPEYEEVDIPLDEFNSLSPKYLKNFMTPSKQTLKNNIVSFMQDVLADPKTHNIKTQQAYTYCGWVQLKDPDGVLRYKHIRPNDSMFASQAEEDNIADNASTAGSEQVYKETQLKVMRSSLLYVYLTAHYFGAYAKGIIPRSADYSPIIYIKGKRSRGKTTFLFCLGSHQGRPEKKFTVFDSKSTVQGLQRLMPWFKHGGFCLDEIDKFMNDRDGMENLMAYANNGGRVIAHKDKGVKFQDTWDIVIFSTGNTDMTQHRNFKEDGKSDAVLSRFDIRDISSETLTGFTVDTEEQKKELATYVTTLRNNYGWGYKAITKLLEEAEYKAELKRTSGDSSAISSYQEVYNKFFEEISADKELHSIDEEKRISEHLAFAAVGSELMRDYFGQEAWELAQKAIKIVTDEYRTAVTEHGDIIFTKDQREALERYEEVFDFVASNTGNFIWENYAFDHNREVDQKEKAKMLSKDARESALKVFGAVIQNKRMNNAADLEGEMYLNSEGEKAFGDSKVQQLRQDLATLGLLVQKTKRNGEVEDRIELGKAARNTYGFSRALRFKLVSPAQLEQERRNELRRQAEARVCEEELKRNETRDKLNDIFNNENYDDIEATEKYLGTTMNYYDDEFDSFNDENN